MACGGDKEGRACVLLPASLGLYQRFPNTQVSGFRTLKNYPEPQRTFAYVDYICCYLLS